MIHSLLVDLRQAVRHTRRDWRFTATLAVTLAAGVAATAIVFHVLNNTLLRPLPIPDEQQVFRVLDWTRGPDGEPVRRSTRTHNFLAIQSAATSFEAVVGLRAINVALDAGSDPVQAYIGLISPGAFGLLGVRPIAGRAFTPEEESAGVDAGVIVISHALWQQQLGARGDIVGSTVRLDGRPHVIVGVLGPGFRFPYQVDAWIPERVAPALEASLATLVRLKRTVTRAQAEQELAAIAAAVERQRPDTNRGMGFVMLPLREHLIGDDADLTWILLATAALLLGLSCANVTNLLLARGARRAREIAVRAALGASRARQIRELIGESLVYAIVGTTLGLAVSAVASDAVMTLVPLPLREQLGLGDTRFDWRVAFFASAVMAVTTLVAGLAPARRLAQSSAVETLRQSGRSTTGPRALMQTLVIGEVALASVLLLAAGLMAQNLSRLNAADLGLVADGVSAVEITLPPSRYADGPTRLALSRVMLDTARSVAGVERAGLVTTNPLDRGSFGAGIETAERPLAPGEAALIVNHRLVSDGWLEAAGVGLVHGRLFDERDSERSPPVAIVSRRMAARLWPGGDAVGKRIRMARPNVPWLTVVGVVADVRDYGDWRDTWYLPYAQHANTFAAGTVHLMLRSSLDAGALGRGLREGMRGVDPALPIPAPTPMRAFWAASLDADRLAASASTLFGLSGLLLAVMGTYSVLAYAVAARTRELGIRFALGATRRTVLVDVIRRGVVLASAGIGLGVLTGQAVNRVLTSVASEAPGLSLTLVAGVTLAIGTSAVAASAIPAWRAMRVDPADVMRAE